MHKDSELERIIIERENLSQISTDFDIFSVT